MSNNENEQETSEYKGIVSIDQQRIIKIKKIERKKTSEYKEFEKSEFKIPI